MRVFLAFALLLSAGQVAAGDFVYQPINPSFGGNPLNGTVLLNSAQIQNQYDDVEEEDPFEPNDPIADFSQRITSSLVAATATEISNEIFESADGESGTFRVDNILIDFANTGGQLTISISDSGTGGSTTVVVPAP